MECEAGERCLREACHPESRCFEGGDCDRGEICLRNECRERNACAPGLACRDHDDCAGGQVCVDRVCEDEECPNVNVGAACEDNGDCGRDGLCLVGLQAGYCTIDADELLPRRRGGQHRRRGEPALDVREALRPPSAMQGGIRVPRQ